MLLTLKCKTCTKSFKTQPSRLKVGKGKFCSKKCYGQSKQRKKIELRCLRCKKVRFLHKSRINGGLRKYCSKSCFYISNRGEGNHLWGGKSASYGAQHAWIRRRLGTATFCSSCGLNKIPEGKLRFFGWANVSGKYLRDTADYISLCVICHKAFDCKF